MEKMHDVLVMMGRLGGAESFLREIRSAITMLTDSFLGETPVLKPAPENHQRIAIFMPGFFANIAYYRRLINFFYQNGIHLLAPQDFRRNTLSWKQAHGLLSKSIKDAEDSAGIEPILIGHSKGGTDIIGILKNHEEIRQVILIAAPLRGSSLKALEYYLERFWQDPGTPFEDDILKEQSILEKITVITSFADRIVPPSEARLPGAKREIIIDGHDTPQTLWDSHTGLPYYSREEILKCLSLEQKAA